MTDNTIGILNSSLLNKACNRRTYWARVVLGCQWSFYHFILESNKLQTDFLIFKVSEYDKHHIVFATFTPA